MSSTSSTAAGNPAQCEVNDFVSWLRTCPSATIPRLASGPPVSSPSTGPTAAPSRNRESADKTRDVIQNYESHQDREQKQSNLHRNLAMTQFERLPPHSLDHEKQQM